MPTIKNYKADLRGKYRRYFEISLLLSMIIVAFKLTNEITEDLLLDDISIGLNVDLGLPPVIPDPPRIVDDEPFIE